MRSANLLNDFAFKYVFGQDCEEANNALKALLSVFMEREIRRVKVKNSELFKVVEHMKNSRLDLFVEFDDGEQIDLEMQLSKTADDLRARFGYYLARLHGEQDMEGKLYMDIKATNVLVFCNINLFMHKDLCKTFQFRDSHGECYEENPKMKIIIVEMPRLNEEKNLSEMSEKEKLIYYFLHCQNIDTDSKMKTIIESSEVIQMVEKRVSNIKEDRWEELLDYFEKLHESEREMEHKLALQQAKEAKKTLEIEKRKVEKLKKETKQELEVERKKIEQERQKAEQERQKAEQERQKTEQERQKTEQERQKVGKLILELTKTMPKEKVASLLNLSLKDIEAYLEDA